MAGRRRSAGEVSQGCRDAAASNTHEGWINRGAGTFSQSQWRRRFRPDRRVALGGIAARQSLSTPIIVSGTESCIGGIVGADVYRRDDIGRDQRAS